jgi:hypothetical protein
VAIVVGAVHDGRAGLTTNESGIRGLLFVALVLGAAVIWPLYFIDLFPLSEARDWLGWSTNDDIVRQSLSNLLSRDTRFSRDFSMLLMFGIGRVCDSSIRCVNVLAALPLVLSSLALYGLIVVLSGRAALAALATMTWSLSLPFLSTAAWQATIHDRVGMLCTLCAMAMAWRYRPDAAVWKLAGYSITLAGLTFAALNSKEAYWFAPVAVVLCHGLRMAQPRSRRSVARDFLVLLPMLTYGIWFAIRYLEASEFAADWSRHVGSGNVASNLVAYAKYATGGVVALVLLITLVLTLMTRIWSTVDATVRAKMVWCGLTLVLAFLPIARTRYAAPYYALAPLALLLALVALIIASRNQQPASRFGSLLMTLIVIAGTALALISNTANQHRERALLSKNFTAAIAGRESLAREAVERKGLCLLADPKQGQSYLFTDSRFAWDILRWNSKNEPLPALKTIPVYTMSQPECARVQMNENLTVKP